MLVRENCGELVPITSYCLSASDADNTMAICSSQNLLLLAVQVMHKTLVHARMPHKHTMYN